MDAPSTADDTVLGVLEIGGWVLFVASLGAVAWWAFGVIGLGIAVAIVAASAMTRWDRRRRRQT